MDGLAHELGMSKKTLYAHSRARMRSLPPSSRRGR
jgi:hypothetical protein